MNYELKFYFGVDSNEVQYLGSYALADEYTFNHYRDFIESGRPFSIWFEHYDNESYHKNVLVDKSSKTFEGSIDNNETKVYFIIITNPANLKILTETEFNNQDRIYELINQISKESITFFIK